MSREPSQWHMDSLSPIPWFDRYLELIFANDELWEQFQMYVRENTHRTGKAIRKNKNSCDICCGCFWRYSSGLC